MTSILARQQAALQRQAEQLRRQRERRDQINRERAQREARQRRLNEAAARKRAGITQHPFTVPKEILEHYDYTCYLVGGGPSLIDFDWSKLDDKYVVGINRAYEVLPNAQIIYFTDDDWWNVHKPSLLEHKGQLIKGSLNLDRLHHPRVAQYHLTGEIGWEKGMGKLKHGRNSSYACINMIVEHLGFKKIYLLGLDMKWGRKGDKSTSHWHSGHKRTDAEAVYNIMTRNISTIPKSLIDNGHQDVEIISVNTPEKCDLKTFPMKSFEEVFGS